MTNSEIITAFKSIRLLVFTCGIVQLCCCGTKKYFQITNKLKLTDHLSTLTDQKSKKSVADNI